MYFDQNAPGKGTPLYFLVLIIGVTFTMSGLIGMYNQGKTTGNITKDNLKTGARYETWCMRQDNEGKYIVLLNHDNDFTCHRLDQQPPSVFKKTNDPKNPYQPYPR